MARLRALTAPEDDPATEERPFYTKVLTGSWDDVGGKTAKYFIVCDEGWRSHIVCEGMYEWAADWLIDQLARKPYGR